MSEPDATVKPDISSNKEPSFFNKVVDKYSNVPMKNFNSPLILPIIILLYCAVQPALSGLWYMLSLIFFSIIRIGIFSLFEVTNENCSFDVVLTTTLNPIIFICIFTLVFVLTPMILYSQYKVYVIIILICYTITSYSLIMACFKDKQLMFDIILGIMFGITSFFIINGFYMAVNKEPNYLFIVSAGSVEKCSIASKQNFKCQVYKNGQLISSTVNKPGYSL